MNIAVMRAVDRFAGIPLCLIAGAIARLRPRSEPQNPLQTILVIKLFGLGSVLLSSPFLSVLKRHFPESRIFYLTFSSNKDLLDKLPQPTDRLIISTSSVFEFIRDTFTVLGLLRGQTIDIVFDLEFFSKFSTLISTLSNAPVRVGYALPTRWRRHNITHHIPLDHSAHVVHVFLRQLSALNISPENDLVSTPVLPSPEERRSASRKLGLGTNGFEVICVNMNAGTTSLERRWEPARFLEVVEAMLKERRTRRFFFIGNRDEREYVQRHLDTKPGLRGHVLNCAGMITVGELAALFERSSLLLTNDSGPMHIADSLGTPVVALFGPESPQFYGPNGNARTIYKALSCSPCLNMYNAKLFRCPYSARCMSEISTDEVLRAISKIPTFARSGAS